MPDKGKHIDDACVLAAEALEAYRYRTPMKMITKLYGLKRDQVLALVDEAGYARHSEVVKSAPSLTLLATVAAGRTGKRQGVAQTLHHIAEVSEGLTRLACSVADTPELAALARAAHNTLAGDLMGVAFELGDGTLFADTFTHLLEQS